MIKGLVVLTAAIASLISAANAVQSVENIFSPEHTNTLVMEIEAAIAEAQADHGVISQKAAREIQRTANIEYAPLDQIAEENKRVRHRMVALLNVWRRSLSPEAQAALHYGVTTVDIYDTVRILQIKSTVELLREEMYGIEEQLITLAAAHRDTPMIGRTLGQHALPITFGKKVSTWAAANRRNIERLNELECRLNTLGVLRGAVGTHLGLGPQGQSIEQQVAASLGLGPVNPADWHGLRDVFGEYAAILTITARTYASIGEEVFLLQMTDIGELHETRPATAISSSTMPHKRNPSRSEALMHWGRVLPAKSDILIDDIANKFERDNTSRPNRVIGEMSIDAAAMLRDLRLLLQRLEVDEERMASNILRTDGMVLSQRIVFFLQDKIGKEAAETHVTQAARLSLEQNRPFRETLLTDPLLGPHLEDEIDRLLDPVTYLGLSAEQVDDTIAWLSAKQSPGRCSTSR